MKLLFIGPNGNVNKGSLRLVCSKNASNVCLLQLIGKFHFFVKSISRHFREIDFTKKLCHCMIMIIKDLLLYGTIEKMICFLVLKYCIICTYIKKSYFESENEIQKTCRLFCSKSSTSQPAFRHKNTAKLAPFPRQKYEY